MSSQHQYLKILVREALECAKYSVQTKENNKKSSANILRVDDKNDSTIGKTEGL